MSLSKEFVREHYLGTGHYEELYEARRRGNEEPPPPALPDEIIKQTGTIRKHVRAINWSAILITNAFINTPHFPL